MHTYFIIIRVIGRAFGFRATRSSLQFHLVQTRNWLLLMDVNRNNKHQIRLEKWLWPDCTNCLKTDRALSISIKWLKFARVFADMLLELLLLLLSRII